MKRLLALIGILMVTMPVYAQSGADSNPALPTSNEEKEMQMQEEVTPQSSHSHNHNIVPTPEEAKDREEQEESPASIDSSMTTEEQ